MDFFSGDRITTEFDTWKMLLTGLIVLLLGDTTVTVSVLNFAGDVLGGNTIQNYKSKLFIDIVPLSTL